jgi:hypothetical protein
LAPIHPPLVAFSGPSRTLLMRLFSWWILKGSHSVRRRLQRMIMWRRTLLRSLFRWWILKRPSVRRLWRMTMWRRTMLRRMMLKRLCRWRILGRRGSLWRILRWRSTSGSAVYGIFEKLEYSNPLCSAVKQSVRNGFLE